MADKEYASYEANNGSHHQHHQKATSTTIQLPSLTSKPLKQQPDMKEPYDSNQTDSSQPSSYYLNVAQKGKLILPTALWILLIVAGFSFLTLLASLNRTVDTLDTLIELEQEKESHHMDERLHHFQRILDDHHGQHNNKEQQTEEPSSARPRPSRKDQHRIEADQSAFVLPVGSFISSPIDSFRDFDQQRIEAVQSPYELPVGSPISSLIDSFRGFGQNRIGAVQSPYELPVGSPISSLIDSFGDFDQTMAVAAIANKHEQHPRRRPVDEVQKLKDDAKWDVLSNDLADSFLQSLIQPPHSIGSELGHQLGGQQQLQSFILVNGKPLDQTMTATIAHKHEQHPRRRPVDEVQKLKDDAKWDVLSNDLADSFLQSLIQAPQSSGSEHVHQSANQQQPQPVILVNGKPLDQSERQKFLNSPLFPEASSNKDHDNGSQTSSENISEPSAKSISDMLNLFFGPLPSQPAASSAPSSTTKSVTAEQKRGQKDGAEESKLFQELKDELEQSLSMPVTIVKTGGDQNGGSSVQPASESPSELWSLIRPSSAPASKSEETSKATHQNSNDFSSMNDLIRTMFTSPQFGDSSSQQEVGGNSGGLSGGGSSSSEEPSDTNSNSDDDELQWLGGDSFLDNSSQELDPEYLEYEILE